MRQIVKLPLDTTVQTQLQQKQNNINDGSAQPNWRLNPNQRNEITTKLLASQKHLCCYCECTINANDIHIEHFFERSDRPNMIYNYTDNLLLSCEGDRQKTNNPETTLQEEERKANISCGHKKGETYHNGIAVNYNLLLSPIDDNSELLNYNDSGEIVGLSEISSEIEQVNYTIQRLNLDSQKLRNRRIDQIEDVDNEIRGLSLLEQKKIITNYLNETKSNFPAYFSTIKNYFGFILAN